METLKFKELELNLDSNLFKIDKEEIPLTKIEFKLMEYLLSNLNKLISREELLEEVWKKDVTLRTVDTTISRLRKKLKDYSDYIQSRNGFGYGIINNDK